MRSFVVRVGTQLRHLVNRCTSLDVLSITWLLLPSLRPWVLCGLVLVADGAVHEILSILKPDISRGENRSHRRK